MLPKQPDPKSRRKKIRKKRYNGMESDPKWEEKPVAVVAKSTLPRMADSACPSLQQFLALPLNITARICRCLSPPEILSLARTSKSLRAFFMSRHSKPLWDEVRFARGIPDWRHVAAPQAMAFLFGSTCQEIGCDLYAAVEAFNLCRRYCLRCAEKNLVDSTDVLQEFPDFPDALLIHLPWTRKEPPATKDSARNSRYYLKDDVLRLWRRFQVCARHGPSAVAELHQSLADTKKDRKLATAEVWSWYRQQIRHEREASSERWMTIRRTMRQRWGWEPVEFESLPPLLRTLVEYLINVPFLSEEVWQSVRGDMTDAIQMEKRKKDKRPFSLHSHLPN